MATYETTTTDVIPVMEDGSSTNPDAAAPAAAPPPPPSPSNVEPGTSNTSDGDKIDKPLALDSGQWDINSISALAALRMLIQALMALADATGDIPPTPPVSRPVTPNTEEQRQLALRRISSPEASLSIGSPEAHPHEPITLIHGSTVPPTDVQHAAIARRFFSRTVPPFSLEQYLLRFHHFCPHSAGVYLGAASFIHRLCITDLEVPATHRTIHRLALGSIRVAEKTLEDNKWRQKRTAEIGGVSGHALMHLELALCYLLEFELGLGATSMAEGMFGLQQAARQSKTARGGLNETFKLKLPERKRRALEKESSRSVG